MRPNITDPASLEEGLHQYFASRDELRLAATPDFPLALNVALPSGLSSDHGHIGIRFEPFSVTGLDSLRIGPAPATSDAGPTELRLDWGTLRVSGRYHVTAKSSPLITLDTGGSMMDYDDEVRTAGAAGLTPIDDATKAAMLDQARAQRTRLMDDPNGQVLMSTYNEHNEVYNTVFANSAVARTAWAAEGATKEMALHTHSAVGAAAKPPVNPPGSTTTFGPNKISYNENAFNQQLQIVVNTMAADPNFDPFDPNAQPDPNSKYTKASLAALTFGTGVGQTGNSKGNVTPLSSDQVYSHVKTGTKPPESSVDELSNLLQQGTQPGGAAAAVAQARNWRVLDESDRRLVRRHLHQGARERAARQSVQYETLWTGPCEALFAGAAAHLELHIDSQGTQATVKAVELPAFEFELDDSGWSGPTATLVRERLTEVAFIRSLLRERIENGLVDCLHQALLSTLGSR